jgi:hypothetical protein
MSDVVSTLPKESGLTSQTFAGFSGQEVANFFSLGESYKGQALINLALQKPLNQMQSDWARQVSSFSHYQPGLEYLAQHPKDSHYHGDFTLSFSSFNIGKLFDRLFTITPQSFTPANLARDFAQSTIGTLTAGTLNVTNLRVANVPVSGGGTHDATVISSFATGATSFGQVQAGNPALKESLVNTVARLFGGIYDAVAVSAVAPTWLSTPVPTAAESGYVAPLTIGQKSLNLLSSGIVFGSQSTIIANLSQAVVVVFGRRVGGAILALLGGNIQQAVQIFNSPNPSQPINLYGVVSSSGGGGGGFLPNQNTGQLSMTSVIIPIMGIGVIGLLLWYFLRKKV